MNTPTIQPRPCPGATQATARRRASDRLRRAVPLSALPLLAMLSGSILPSGMPVVPEAGAVTFAAALLFGVVSLPALEAGSGHLHRLATAAAGTALAVLTPATTALGCLAASLLGVAVPDAGWAVIAAAGPVSVGAAISARRLGLSQRRMAGLMVWSTLAATLAVPQLAWCTGAAGVAGVQALAGQVAIGSGLPLLAGLALRQLPALARPTTRHAASDIALAALSLLGLLRGAGLAEEIAHDPASAAEPALLALVVVGSGIAATRLVVWRMPEAVLGGVFRSNALVWASLSPVLPERANLLMALITATTYTAPLLAGLVQRVGR